MLRGDGGEYVTMDSLDLKGCVMCGNPQTRSSKSHVQRRCSSYLTLRSDALVLKFLVLKFCSIKIVIKIQTNSV